MVGIVLPWTATTSKLDHPLVVAVKKRLGICPSLW
jgi:hypothetical protein